MNTSRCEAGSLQREGSGNQTYWSVSCAFCSWSHRARTFAAATVTDRLADHIAQHHRIERALDWSWAPGWAAPLVQAAHHREQNEQLRAQLAELEARWGPGDRLWPVSHVNPS